MLALSIFFLAIILFLGLIFNGFEFIFSSPIGIILFILGIVYTTICVMIFKKK